ncbi:HORMA domain-containing protein [Ochromonadaceae sp. CCMP2298]|nr:HORMA domain-containing protein [Ochromonadaceae sp. CCMP2298]
MSTKQATKSKDATISRQDAMVLIKNMVRISISSICFIRDLFPPECFKNKQYGQVDIHQLQGAKKEDNGDVTVHHEDAFLLTQWLEQGVFMALEDEYMSALVFAIYTQHPISGKDLLLETYEFKFAYPDGSGAAKINDVALVSKDTVKSQAAKFIRSLTEFTHTLDDLPVERWISLQLKYTDETPADYEPDYFTASDGSISAIADRFRLKINFGNIKTPTLDMRVKYCGLDSLLFDDLCEVSERGEGRQRVKPESVFSGTNFSEASNEAVHATLNSPRTLSSPLTETMQRLAVSPLPSRPKPEEKPETPTSMVKKFM